MNDKTLEYGIPLSVAPTLPSEAFPNMTNTLVPVTDVILRKGGRNIPCLAIFDSASTFCVFPFSMGEELGLDVEKGKKAKILNTGEVVYFWDIQVTLHRAFEFPLFAGFSRHDERRKIGLLGQLGFFDRFQVRIDYPNRLVGLVPKSPDISVLITDASQSV